MTSVKICTYVPSTVPSRFMIQLNIMIQTNSKPHHKPSDRKKKHTELKHYNWAGRRTGVHVARFCFKTLSGLCEEVAGLQYKRLIPRYLVIAHKNKRNSD